MSKIDSGELLLVEDDSQDLEMALRALTKADLGHRVQIARDGVEALEIIFGEGRHADRVSAERPKVILLDLKLPRINGLEVLKRIKSAAHTKTIPVIMLTSSKEQIDINESYRLGANSYVVKPVNFEQFAKAVHDLGLYWLLLNQPPEEA
jgi:two-component system, response regulator